MSSFAKTVCYVNNNGYACLKMPYLLKTCTEQIYASWLEKLCSLCKEQQETNIKKPCYSKWKSVVEQKRRCPFQPNGMLP